MNLFTCSAAKKLLAAIGSGVVALSAYSQGSIFFSNEPLSTGGDVNAPVSDATGVRLAGPGFVAQLWARPAGSSSSYFAVGDPVAFLPAGASPSGDGYWIPTTLNIPGIPAGAPAEVTARVWRLADGATWEAVRAAGRCWGESNPITVILGGGTVLPAEMVGLQPFSGLCVPEPFTVALGIVGGLGALLFVRHRK